jgi:hypothetical protein
VTGRSSTAKKARVVLVVVAAGVVMASVLSATDAGASSATGQLAGAERIYALTLNDGFTLGGSRVGCVVQKKGQLTLVCFRQTAPLSYRPKPRTYVAIVYAIAVGVELFTGPGSARPVFARRQPRPSGIPTVASQAVPLVGGVARLRHGKGAYLRGTHTVCLNVGSHPELVCGEDHARGAVPGSYYVFVDDSGVRVARLRSGAMSFVFRGVNH